MEKVDLDKMSPEDLELSINKQNFCLSLTIQNP